MMVGVMVCEGLLESDAMLVVMVVTVVCKIAGERGGLSNVGSVRKRRRAMQ